MTQIKKDKQKMIKNSINFLAEAKTNEEILAALKWAVIHLLQNLKEQNKQTEPKTVSVSTVTSRE